MRIGAICAAAAMIVAAPAAAPAFAKDKANAPKPWKDFYGETQPEYIPADVRAFIIDGQACTHFAGEEGYDKKRAAYLKKMTDKHCRDLDTRKESIAKRFTPDEALLALLDKAWENERPAMRLYAEPRIAIPTPPPILPKKLNSEDSAKIVAQMLAGTSGTWEGKLEYRDYQSNQWFGLPLKLSIVAQPDGVTTVRTAEYDDGPQTGLVWITTVQQVDIATFTITYDQFRKGRTPDAGMAKVTGFARTGVDQWNFVTEERRKDGNGFAMVRETTTRDGDSLVTLKEVDPEGDGKTEYLQRNRTTLTRVK
jgi:hypothetical protein